MRKYIYIFIFIKFIGCNQISYNDSYNIKDSKINNFFNEIRNKKYDSALKLINQNQLNLYSKEYEKVLGHLFYLNLKIYNLQSILLNKWIFKEFNLYKRKEIYLIFKNSTIFSKVNDVIINIILDFTDDFFEKNKRKNLSIFYYKFTKTIDKSIINYLKELAFINNLLIIY